jgi:hypothetical protein
MTSFDNKMKITPFKRVEKPSSPALRSLLKIPYIGTSHSILLFNTEILVTGKIKFCPYKLFVKEVLRRFLWWNVLSMLMNGPVHAHYSAWTLQKNMMRNCRDSIRLGGWNE